MGGELEATGVYSPQHLVFRIGEYRARQHTQRHQFANTYFAIWIELGISAAVIIDFCWNKVCCVIPLMCGTLQDGFGRLTYPMWTEQM